MHLKYFEKLDLF